MSSNKNSGLTQKEVHDECNRIRSDGKEPTALSLRDHLLKGSLSTITKHLNSWRANNV